MTENNEVSVSMYVMDTDYTKSVAYPALVCSPQPLVGSSERIRVDKRLEAEKKWLFYSKRNSVRL